MKKRGGQRVLGPVVELPPGRWPVTPGGALRAFMHISELHAERRRRPPAGPFEEFRILTMRMGLPRRRPAR